jgi:hypothetical protein
MVSTRIMTPETRDILNQPNQHEKNFNKNELKKHLQNIHMYDSILLGNAADSIFNL